MHATIADVKQVPNGRLTARQWAVWFLIGIIAPIGGLFLGTYLAGLTDPQPAFEDSMGLEVLVYLAVVGLLSALCTAIVVLGIAAIIGRRTFWAAASGVGVAFALIIVS